MPIVNVTMFEGRTIEQKRAMVKGFTEVLVKTVNCNAVNVQVMIHDIPRYNVGKAGILMSDKET